jgi:hypothetical protein
MTAKAWKEATNPTLWLVGRYRGPDPPLPAQALPENGVLAPWEFMGIFTTREKAVEACTNRYDYVAPVRLDVREPEEATGFPDSFYPLYGREEQAK